MDLTELKQYPHKILTITVDNKNDITNSMSETALFKVTIPDKKDNEIIIFSYDKELTTAIPRTQKGNDYFLTIANTTGITIIYAHFLMLDLYNYTEEEANDGAFVEYDLTSLQDSNIHNVGYTSKSDKHLKVTSKLPNSFTEIKDPNYKQYNIDLDINGKPLKDRFPVASRYSQKNKQIIAPDIKQTPTATFTRSDNDITSEWEARIYYKDIGDIIPQDTDNIQHPVNVFLNYEYLPSSTEYHQHFYGFEGGAQTENKDINIFEGDNLETINKAFLGDNDENYTYRLINWGNKSDNKNAKYVSHYIPPIYPTESTEPIIYNDNCDWIKNDCDDYYIYTALTNTADRGVYFSSFELKSNTSYILKYYIYIPQDIKDDELTDCYIEIQEIDRTKSEQTSWSIDNIFNKQDKFLTDRWVYHEVPFQTSTSEHRLYIRGHTDIGKSIYFANIEIQEIVQYSPTIKYTNQGVFVVEGNESVGKPNSDYETNTFTNIPFQSPKITETTEPVEPYNQVNIHIADDFGVEYNKQTKSLYYYPTEDHHISYIKEYNQDTNEEEWNLYIDNNMNNEDETLLSLDYDEQEGEEKGKYFTINYQPKETFTYGTNNNIKLIVENEHKKSIGNGFVECAITANTNEEDDIKNGSNSLKYLGKQYVQPDGSIEYNRLDFTNLYDSSNNIFYLRIDYTHPCFDTTSHTFKRIYIVDENITMTIKADETEVNNKTTYEVHHIEEFPLKITANIKTGPNTKADWGYCELSIDDEVRQTSYVNSDGIAEFYLNKNTDNLTTSQIIKIEYYRKYNAVRAYDFFNLTLANDFEGKDAVPIRFNYLNNDINKQISNNIDIEKDDCLLINIDTSDSKYRNYSIRIYKEKNNNKEYIPFNNGNNYINITSSSDENIVIGDYAEETANNIKYCIVTDSLIGNINDEDIAYNNNKYRQYEKCITINWTEVKNGNNLS